MSLRDCVLMRAASSWPVPRSSVAGGWPRTTLGGVGEGKAHLSGMVQEKVLGWSRTPTEGTPMSDLLHSEQSTHTATPPFTASERLATHLQQLSVDLIDLHLVGKQ